MILHFLVLTILISQIKTKNDQCYVKSESPYLHFGDRTPYSATCGHEMHTPTDCEPIYIWSLIRHGTRYPENKLIKSVGKMYVLRDEIIQNHNAGRGELCEEDLQNLARWSSNLITDSVQEYELAPQGKQDHISLARKMKEDFSKLLKSSTKDNFMFKSSDVKRTKESAVAFTNELLGTDFKTTEGNNIIEDAEHLQPNQHCPKFLKVEKNPSVWNEPNLFTQTAHFRKIMSEISIRLGYLQTLPFDTCWLMFDACGYESAWYVGSRPAFCAAFSTNDLENFDYRYDLIVYHMRGNGHPFSYQLGCPIVRDMMTSLKHASENGSQTRKGKFLFTHSETIVPATLRLGFYKDNETLRHDNYQKMIKHRKFRSSQFDSFASNIVAVLYTCSSQSGNKTKVSIYQNEHATKFPECNNSSLCDLEFILERYSDVLDESRCNMKFCQESDTSKEPNGRSRGSKLTVWSLSIFVMILSLMFYDNVGRYTNYK